MVATAAPGFGPRRMGSFESVVLLFYVAALTHAFWALSSEDWAHVADISYRLGVLGFDFNLATEGDILEGGPMDGWPVVWFSLCSCLLYTSPSPRDRG
eukprot:2907910-Rhodomonas_salina.1